MIYVEDRLIPEKTDSFAVLPQHIYNKGKQHKGVVMKSKKCNKCGEVKRMDEFHPHKRHKDGRTYTCKECWRAHARKMHKLRPPEYTNWFGAKLRCSRPKDKCYHLYGGRGITMCDEWVKSFDQFLKDMGPKPSPKHELDRIDSDGNYEPSNCRWVTHTDNIRNRKATKLSVEKAREIRKLVSIGLEDVFLGRIYGVARSTIGDVRKKRTWVDVA